MFLFFINLLNSEPGNNVCVQEKFKDLSPFVNYWSTDQAVRGTLICSQFLELRHFDFDKASSNFEYFIWKLASRDIAVLSTIE